MSDTELPAQSTDADRLREAVAAVIAQFWDATDSPEDAADALIAAGLVAPVPSRPEADTADRALAAELVKAHQTIASQRAMLDLLARHPSALADAAAPVPSPTDEAVAAWSEPPPKVSGVCACCGEGPDAWCLPTCSAKSPLWPAAAVPSPSAPTGEGTDTP